jgi:hypothetical protein
MFNRWRYSFISYLLTLAELPWSQVINFLRDPKGGCGCSPTLRHLWSNVQQMAQQFYFIFSVSGHLVEHYSTDGASQSWKATKNAN